MDCNDKDIKPVIYNANQEQIHAETELWEKETDSSWTCTKKDVVRVKTEPCEEESTPAIVYINQEAVTVKTEPSEEETNPCSEYQASTAKLWNKEVNLITDQQCSTVTPEKEMNSVQKIVNQEDTNSKSPRQAISCFRNAIKAKIQLQQKSDKEDPPLIMRKKMPVSLKIKQELKSSEDGRKKGADQGCADEMISDESTESDKRRMALLQLSHLVDGRQVNSTEGPYTCEECGKGFRSKWYLIYHIRAHTGERPYECEECGRRFSQKGSLNSHARIHTGEKPYACEECGKRFSQKCSLNIHTRIHRGERPYTCEECGQGFSQKGSLDQHIRTHTGEKPFECGECGKTFTQKSGLFHHSRIHKG